MSNNQEYEVSPDFGFNGNNNTTDDSMFVSVPVPETMDVILTDDDDDDENPFGISDTREKTPTTTTNTVESHVDDQIKSFQAETLAPPVEKIAEEDLFESELSKDTSSPFIDVPETSTFVSKQQVPTPPSTPIKQETLIFATSLNATAIESLRHVPVYESHSSLSKPVASSIFEERRTESKPIEKRTNTDIKITVGEPTKVGEGISSYVIYRITTITTSPIFQKSEFSVSRRFSDFLGLHVKMIGKHLHHGFIIPSPPEKDSLSMAKVKMTREEVIPVDFIDRRRALLERYLNRLVKHPKLIEDVDVREFLEFSKELPKSTHTQALSGAGVLRAFNTISNQVTKIGTKKSEQDEWFDEKHVFVEDLHRNYKHLYNEFNTLFTNRKEATYALSCFSKSLNHLATTEEHTSVSSALIELANLQEKLVTINNDQKLKEYSIITELIKEYVSLLEMVQLAFHERIKVHQIWLNAEETLRKKREAKIKLQQSAKGIDKIPHVEMEITEWEKRVVQTKEDFESISTTIKQEMDIFEQTRLEDFQQAINNYLNSLLAQEQEILCIWENYLPEANKINV